MRNIINLFGIMLLLSGFSSYSQGKEDQNKSRVLIGNHIDRDSHIIAEVEVNAIYIVRQPRKTIPRGDESFDFYPKIDYGYVFELKLLKILQLAKEQDKLDKNDSVYLYLPEHSNLSINNRLFQRLLLAEKRVVVAGKLIGKDDIVVRMTVRTSPNGLIMREINLVNGMYAPGELSMDYNDVVKKNSFISSGDGFGIIFEDDEEDWRNLLETIEELKLPALHPSEEK